MHAFRPLTEPPGPASPALADRRPVAAEIVFAGARLASPQRLWLIVDVAVILAIAAAGFAGGYVLDVVPAAWAITGAVVGLLVTGADLVRTGRTIGHRILGTRTVSATTGLPAAGRDLLRTRTVDVRKGRDPVRLTPRTAEKAASQDDRWRITASRALDAPIVLTLDNGMAFSLVGPTVIGRNPAPVDGSKVLQLPDLSRTVSKSHALLEPQGGVLWVTDLGSMNGTAVAEPGQSLQPLPPRTRTIVRAGATVEFGDRTATVGTTTDPHPATRRTGA